MQIQSYSIVGPDDWAGSPRLMTERGGWYVASRREFGKSQLGQADSPNFAARPLVRLNIASVRPTAINTQVS